MWKSRPRRRHVARPAKSAGMHRAPAPPPTRGLPHLVHPPRARHVGLGNLQDVREITTHTWPNRPALENRLHKILDTTAHPGIPGLTSHFQRRSKEEASSN